MSRSVFAEGPPELGGAPPPRNRDLPPPRTVDKSGADHDIGGPEDRRHDRPDQGHTTKEGTMTTRRQVEAERFKIGLVIIVLILLLLLG